MHDEDAVRECLAAYDRWAATYDSIDNPLVALATTVLAARGDDVAGARVLELGCGTGRNAAWCLAAGARGYVGVDASAGMLAVARERVDDGRARFVVGDLTRAAADVVEPEAFDVVLVCLVLEHLADVAPVMATAARALRPGGELWAIELHPGLHDRGVGANFRDGEREVRLPSVRHDAAELVAAAERAGVLAPEAIEHAPTEAALARSPKLARYAGRPVLLELRATSRRR